jgi:hypothetical protein
MRLPENNKSKNNRVTLKINKTPAIIMTASDK